jgi:hypothetical protein
MTQKVCLHAFLRINDLLISRILETPDEPRLNSALFAFLNERASETVLREVLKQDPTLLARRTSRVWRIYHDPCIRLYTRVHALGILPDELRRETVDRLERAIFDDLDGSFLDEDNFLSLFPPTRLLALSVRLCGELLDTLPDKIENIVDDADLEIDPKDNFDDVSSFVNTLESVFAESDSVQERITDAKNLLTEAIETVSEKKRDSSVEWEGDDVTPSKVTAPAGGRSLFSDVDT